MSRKKLSFLMALALGATALTACTHNRAITADFDPSYATHVQGMVCTNSESIALEVSSSAADALDAGTTSAGIHTFIHRFAQDPSDVLRETFEAELTNRGCLLEPNASTQLDIDLQEFEARALACGMLTCDAESSGRIELTARSSEGGLIDKEVVVQDGEETCGMAICSESETSELAARVLSQLVGKSLAAIQPMVAAAPAPSEMTESIDQAAPAEGEAE